MKQLIYSLELALLDPVVRKSAEKLNILLANDFIEFGSSGKIYTKEIILNWLPQEPEFTSEIQDFAIKTLSQDIILATYKVIIDNKISLRSSLWQKDQLEWKLLFHQGTKCP